MRHLPFFFFTHSLTRNNKYQFIEYEYHPPGLIETWFVEKQSYF